MSTRDALRAYALALPQGALLPVPRELLLELLNESHPGSEPMRRDLTVAELAVHFNRSPGAVRAWLESGRFEGAYKLQGRAWRVPVASLEKFIAAQRVGAQAKQPVSQVVDLGTWRKLA